jgi:hypothetical protein
VAEAMHRHCVSRVFSAPMFVGIMSAASDLLSTEGSRRRMRLELQRPTEYTDAPVGVTAISNYKKRITG